MKRMNHVIMKKLEGTRFRRAAVIAGRSAGVLAKVFWP